MNLPLADFCTTSEGLYPLCLTTPSNPIHWFYTAQLVDWINSNQTVGLGNNNTVISALEKQSIGFFDPLSKVTEETALAVIQHLFLPEHYQKVFTEMARFNNSRVSEILTGNKEYTNYSSLSRLVDGFGLTSKQPSSLSRCRAFFVGDAWHFCYADVLQLDDVEVPEKLCTWVHIKTNGITTSHRMISQNNLRECYGSAEKDAKQSANHLRGTFMEFLHTTKRITAGSGQLNRAGFSSDYLDPVIQRDWETWQAASKLSK